MKKINEWRTNLSIGKLEDNGVSYIDTSKVYMIRFVGDGDYTFAEVYFEAYTTPVYAKVERESIIDFLNYSIVD